jgi:S-adenosylmethionine hydrolase
VAVVDPEVGGERAGLIVEAGGSFFVGPDNGILSLAARPRGRIFRIESAAFRREPVSPTFHGRDVFAPTAALLARGTSPTEAGPEAKTMIDIARPVVSRRKGLVEGHVIHVDAFGNLITSLGAEHIPPEASIEVEGTAGVFHPVFARTFSDVRAGAMVAYVGSGGQLEIARRNGSAARHIGAERGAIVRVEAA